MESKKLDKFKCKVYDFLNLHRHEDPEVKPTHLSYGLFGGKFVLDKSAKKEFLKIYVEALEAGVKDFSILETQQEYGPIIVDIDLEVPSDDYVENSRLYDEGLINNITEKYIDAINKYLDVPEDQKIFITEKDKPTKKGDDMYKDGFHIMFPSLCIQTSLRHLIRHTVVRMCMDDGTLANYSNSPDKIIDKAVVSTNAWFMYGSKKPTVDTTYKITNVLNFDMQNIADESNFTKEDIIKYLSIQQSSYAKKYATPIKKEFADSDLDAECERLGINSAVKAEELKFDIPSNKEDDVRRANKYTTMLNPNRAGDYHDWLRVGLALHNIDQCMLPTWIEFSKKCSKKYKDGECEKVWRNFKNPTNGCALTIRSLAFWAKQDDPKEFKAFNKEEFSNNMKKSLNGDTYYLAKCAHSRYSDRFVCSNISGKVWWEFANHKWKRIDDGYTLKLLFSEDFADQYNLEIADISIKLTQSKNFEREELQSRRTKIDKIVDRLGDTSFKDRLLKECAPLFYDPEFSEKLDSNLHLIGFDNGVYDLEQKQFREGRPDDFITFSTNIDYTEWNFKNPYFAKIDKFFSQVFPNENVKNYVLTVLSSCLSGENRDEKFYVFTGTGQNGKSMLSDLVIAAFGDYYMSCPISLLTRKRGQSNEAGPEKVRMKGRRFGLFAEADEGDKINVGLMKEFTGGDKVLTRDLFKGSQDMIEFVPQIKSFLTCNKLPEVPSNDDGTWRRIRVVDYTSKFVANPTKPNEYPMDTTLKQKIKLWAPAFISYLIHIYNTKYNIMVDGVYLPIKEPQEVMASTNQYKMENDYYSEYISERITVTTDAKPLSISTIWNDFKSWYSQDHDPKSRPANLEFHKQFSRLINKPHDKKYYGITFTIEENENNAKPNDLDA